MNLIFLSPNFPPNFARFCIRAKDEGLTVLGIGDAAYATLSEELKTALTEYYHVPDMTDADTMLRAVAYFIHHHGRIHRIDSQSEFWLGVEANLRDDFNVPGQRPADLERNRRKSAMKKVFAQAGIPVARGVVVEDIDQMRRFAKEVGYPLVLKPDVGVGAAGTIKVNDDDGLAAALADPRPGYVAEQFITGDVVSFDGLTDGAGKIVFCTSHEYSSGVMEILHERRNMHYYSLREVPPDLERLGRAAVAAFAVRERFFHIEFFRLPSGAYVALEINVRPPGGFSVDMMNFACDIDLYQWWAKVIAGKPLPDSFQRRHHCAHAARRGDWRYRRPHEEIVRTLGQNLAAHLTVPSAYSAVMGDTAYLIRMAELGALKEAIALVEDRE